MTMSELNKQISLVSFTRLNNKKYHSIKVSHMAQHIMTLTQFESIKHCIYIKKTVNIFVAITA